jgi:hypothetical protein
MVFPLTITLAFPVVIIGAWLLSGGALPTQALIVMIGAFAMSIVWMFMSLNERTAADEAGARAASEAFVEREPAIVGHALLEPVYAISPSAGAASFVVTDAAGICPRGFKVNDVFTADAEGRLSRPLCKAAASTLEALVQDARGENGFTPQVSCICPMGDRHLTFEFRKQTLISTN